MPDQDSKTYRQHDLTDSLRRDAIKVRCPHCHNPIELVEVPESGDVLCGSCGSSISLLHHQKTESLLPGAYQTIGHFELLNQVGTGAFGTVFKARDTKLDRTVALKIPRNTQVDGKAAETFLREARAAAQLRQKNIIAVHEVGCERDRVFIVSDFVDGLTLSDWLSGEKPTVLESAKLCIKICDALHYAHENGVIHRDLKPSNIMLDRDNEPYLMDFGLAKREVGEITMTIDGQVLGTPAYMSPEQARGEARNVDRRTDIYSVGVILFELLTGELPFRGNRNMLIHQVLTEEAPSPRKLNMSIPSDMETICLKCLGKTPSKRYSTSAELCSDLKRFIENKPINARPISRFEKGWRWYRRNPLVANLMFSLMLVLLIGGFVSTYFAIDSNNKATELSIALKDIEFQKYASDTLLAGSNAESNQFERAVVRLEKTTEKYRHWEWGNTIARCNQASFEIKLNEGSHQNPFAISHDESWLACESIDTCGVSIYDLETMNLVKQLTIDSSELTVGQICGFDTENRRLITGGSGKPIRIWDIETEDCKIIGEEWGTDASSVFHSADAALLIVSLPKQSQTIIYNYENEQVVSKINCYANSAMLLPDAERILLNTFNYPIFQIKDKTQIKTIGERNGTQYQSILSEDKRQFAIMGTLGTGTIIYDSSSINELFRLDHPPHVSAVCFDSSNQFIFTGARDGSIRIWDGSDNRLINQINGHSDSITKIETFKNGQWLLTASRDKKIRIWPAFWLARSTQRLNANWAVEFSPNGESFATFSKWRGGVVICQTEAPNDPLVQIFAPRNMKDDEIYNRRKVFSWHPEDNQLAICFGEDGVVVYDSLSGKKLSSIKTKTPSDSVLITSDGKSVAVGSEGRIEFFDIATGHKIGQVQDFNGRVFAMCRIANSEKIAAAGIQDQHVKLVDFKTIKVVGQIDLDTEGLCDMDCDEDGKRLAVGVKDSFIAIIVDLALGRSINKISSGNSNKFLKCQAVSISPDGKRVAAFTGERSIGVFDSETGTLLLNRVVDANNVNDVSWSNNAYQIAVVGEGRDSSLLWRSADWEQSALNFNELRRKDWSEKDPIEEARRFWPFSIDRYCWTLASQMQWQKAAQISEAIKNPSMYYYRVGLLYLSDDPQKYRKARRKLVAIFQSMDIANERVQVERFGNVLVASCLEPVDENQKSAIRTFANVVGTPIRGEQFHIWDKGRACMGFYRVGEFDQCIKLLEDEKIKDQWFPLLHHLCVFMHTQNEKNRDTLEKELIKESESLTRAAKASRPGDWFNWYMTRKAWVKEAEKVIAEYDTAQNSKKSLSRNMRQMNDIDA